jgi:hypothetical protein
MAARPEQPHKTRTMMEVNWDRRKLASWSSMETDYSPTAKEKK